MWSLLFAPFYDLSSRANRGICILRRNADPSPSASLRVGMTNLRKIQSPDTPNGSTTARRTTACLVRSLWFQRAHKCAHELFIDLRCDRVHVNARRREELSSVLDAIDSRRLDLDLLKSGGGQLPAIFIFFQSSGDATDPCQHTLTHFRRHLAARDHVGNSELSARFQHAERLAQHAVLVRGKIDHAVG